MLHNQGNARSETPADKSNMQIITPLSKGQTAKEGHIFSGGGSLVKTQNLSLEIAPLTDFDKNVTSFYM